MPARGLNPHAADLKSAPLTTRANWLALYCWYCETCRRKARNAPKKHIISSFFARFWAGAATVGQIVTRQSRYDRYDRYDFLDPSARYDLRQSPENRNDRNDRNDEIRNGRSFLFYTFPAVTIVTIQER